MNLLISFAIIWARFVMIVQSLHSTLVTVGTIVWLFFFSSRRRHTRSDRDWSSDVCSSDLHDVPPGKLCSTVTTSLGPVVVTVTPPSKASAAEEFPGGHRATIGGESSVPEIGRASCRERV